MAYSDNPGCPSCGCRLMNAQASLHGEPTPEWVHCDCRCHDVAKRVVLNIGPTKETT